MLRLVGCRLSLVVLVHDLWRFLAVDPHMFLEVTTFTKSFSAYITNVGSFTSVEPGVYYHFVSLREGLMTKLTRVGSGICMNPFMFSHQVSSLETLGTISALVRPFASVHDTVVQGHFRPSNEARATLFTDKWSFPCVNASMLLHVAFLRKTLVAKIARVGFNARVNT